MGVKIKMKIKKPDSRKKMFSLTISFDDPTLNMLEVIAETEKINRSEIVRQLIERQFKERRYQK